MSPTDNADLPVPSNSGTYAAEREHTTEDAERAATGHGPAECALDREAPIRVVSVTYGETRTVPHPSKQFSNLKPSASVTAECTGSEVHGAISRAKAIVAVTLDSRISEFLGAVRLSGAGREERREELQRELDAIDDAGDIPF